MFSRFGTTLACDRRTNDDSIYRTSLASCGKNSSSVAIVSISAFNKEFSDDGDKTLCNKGINYFTTITIT